MPEPAMRIRGIVRTAMREENPPGSSRSELTLHAQGAGAGHRGTLIVPYELLLADPELDPDIVQGKRFEAEADEADPGRWVVDAIAFATGHFLRRPEDA